jgi:hypothetical protein
MQSETAMSMLVRPRVLAAERARAGKLGAMNLMSLLIIALFLPAAMPVAADERVASLLGEDIMRGQLVQEGRERAREFAALIWPRIARHYVDGHGLNATAAEIAALKAYDDAFGKKDRAQRKRKLAELDQRLKSNDLSPERRAHNEDFRNTLQRLERHDAEADVAPPKPDSAAQAGVYVPWIEMWKMNKALYEQYGGVVALTDFGPDPLGARAAMFADYERQGRLNFYDEPLREQFFAMLAEKPRMVVKPGAVDFTPYWKKPIPSSYYSE